MTDPSVAIGRKVGRRMVRTDTHKFQAVLPNRIWNDLERIASQNNTTIGELIRQLLNMGIITIDHIDSGGTIILQHPDRPDKEIKFLF